MSLPSVPNWLRIILLILSFLSFLPQLLRVFSRKDSSGISTYYMLFNLISMTEQFTLAFFFIVNNIDNPDFFVHNPINAGDWLNLAQLAVVLSLWLILCIACLYFPSDHRDASKRFVLGVYFAFLLISIVPIFTDAVSPGENDARRWNGALFHGVHSLFINPIVTGFGIASLYFQAKETLSRSLPQALSIIGLAAQAIVFAVVAVSWIMRVEFPYGGLDRVSFGVFSTWYQLVGWAALDSAIFALVQAALLWIASRHLRRTNGTSDSETQPLLGR
ncbi:hypothetical protein CC78DRAFT_530455 [Lojkania enalia]|uniref:Uncharacterized protein n=1 Tax=Lojkania enalia TaxID=147567 RepID=A0A9P4N837_9PLEO|nr:hypothetical protein CC78DRAFT_530455 [Didymosphaeria enalia]